ncbi:MAG: glycosyltransferase family 4 protein [Planctomycetes bacterium]|nr:glycosyltransferase family 4 protein [Planctomycetota bacterium]
MPIHVGYVLKKFPRASETFILNEILELQRQGTQVTVFSLNRPDDGVFHRGLAELQRPVIYLPTRKSDAWLGHLQQNVDLLRQGAPRLWAEMEDLLRAARPDFWQILGQGLDVALAARIAGVHRLHAHFATVAAYVARTANALTALPFSVTCHAKDIYRENVTGAQFQSLLGRAAFVVTVCEANRRHIERHLTASLPLRVLYNGVDVEAFHPRHRAPEARPLLLGVGRLVEKKGFHVLLDAAALLARDGIRPRVLLVGDGEEHERLTTQTAALQLRDVEFAGMRTHDEVRSLLTGATAMVLPCIVGADGNRDALPTVLLEAMAAGVPVVSTPVGGVDEIVDGGRAGVLVPENDAPALAHALADLLRNPGRRSTLEQAGRERAEQRFDLRKNVGTLRAWFENATSEGRA